MAENDLSDKRRWRMKEQIEHQLRWLSLGFMMLIGAMSWSCSARPEPSVLERARTIYKEAVEDQVIVHHLKFLVISSYHLWSIGHPVKSIFYDSPYFA
jgi:hypothetical protein